jgi:hypothetical protein
MVPNSTSTTSGFTASIESESRSERLECLERLAMELLPLGMVPAPRYWHQPVRPTAAPG